jgi:hypothetical protein
MNTRDAEARAGLPFEVAAVGLLWAALLAEIFVTYTRLAASELYHVSGSGLVGGASRVLVELNFPIALVAIAVILLLADRLGGTAVAVVAGIGIALCAVLFWPGVVDQGDLDARWINVLPAYGVTIAALLGVLAAATLGRPRRPEWRGAADAARIAVAVVLLVLAVPWMLADLGVSLDGVPVLGSLYQTGELRSQPGVPGLHPAVHHGHHHGMDGVLLVLTALLLSRLLPSVSRRWVRIVTGAYLALMLAYGFAEFANDFWLEQIVKRGWTNWEIPDVTRPKLTIAWGLIVLGAAAIYALAAWRARRPSPPRTLTPAGAES